MARAFRCKGCGTGYSTTGDDVPPSPNWYDGHVCEMIEVESFIVDKTTYTAGDKVESKLEPFETSRLDVDSLKDFNIKQEAKKKAAGYMKLKKSQCQGHAVYSEEQEEEAENRLKIIAQNGPSGLHYGNDNDANFANFQIKKEKSLMFRKEDLDE